MVASVHRLLGYAHKHIVSAGYTAGYDVFEFGDDVSTFYKDERVLVICNHQSTADVPTLMACLQSKGVASRKVSAYVSHHSLQTLWLMDVMFRWTPFGIVGQMHGDYFIQQGKATRDKEILRSANFVSI